MGVAFVALKRGRGQGGFEGASPQWAVTEKPTRPPAPFQCNPERSAASIRDLPAIAFIRPPRLLRRNGPVPGILAVMSDGAIVDKSERRLASNTNIQGLQAFGPSFGVARSGKTHVGYCRFARALKYGPIPCGKGHPH